MSPRGHRFGRQQVVHLDLFAHEEAKLAQEQEVLGAWAAKVRRPPGPPSSGVVDLGSLGR